MVKEVVRRWLTQLGKSVPWFARLCLWGIAPFPRLYVFVARSTGLTSLVVMQTWHIRNGPLAGLNLTSLLPDEIGPVLANSMELCCSNLLEKLPLQSRVALDVGGSYGYYALLLSRVVGESGQVFSFEPDWHSFERLTHNLAINDRKNVTAVPLCLSNTKTGLAIWQSFADKPWYSHLVPYSPNRALGNLTVVPVTTLDAFVNTLDLSEHVGLIKIDVEGAELKVLEGAVELLRKAKPWILCELHGADIAQQVFAFLSQQGYQWEMIEYMSETRQHILAFASEQAEVYRTLAVQ